MWTHVQLEHRLAWLFFDLLLNFFLPIRNQIIQPLEPLLLLLLNSMNGRLWFFWYLFGWIQQSSLDVHSIQLLCHSSHLANQPSSLPSLFVGFHDRDVLAEFETTGARPRTREFAIWTANTLTILTLFCDWIVVLEGMFAQTLKVVCSMCGHVVELSAGTARRLARHRLTLLCADVMFLVSMVA